MKQDKRRKNTLHNSKLLRLRMKKGLTLRAVEKALKALKSKTRAKWQPLTAAGISRLEHTGTKTGRFPTQESSQQLAALYDTPEHEIWPGIDKEREARFGFR